MPVAAGRARTSVVHRFTDAFNRADVDALVGCFTERATYDDGFYGEHEGSEALRAMFERMFREGRDYWWHMDTVVERPDRGTIDVDSEPGRGTTFRIGLPAANGASASVTGVE